MREMYENPYYTNDTMRLLGHQCYTNIITPEVCKMMDDIAKARPHTVVFDTAMDMLTLGYIIGIRAERARRKK